MRRRGSRADPPTRQPIEATDLLLLSILLVPWIALGLVSPSRQADLVGAIAATLLLAVMLQFTLRHVRNRRRYRPHGGA